MGDVKLIGMLGDEVIEYEVGDEISFIFNRVEGVQYTGTISNIAGRFIRVSNIRISAEKEEGLIEVGIGGGFVISIFDILVLHEDRGGINLKTITDEGEKKSLVSTKYLDRVFNLRDRICVELYDSLVSRAVLEGNILHIRGNGDVVLGDCVYAKTPKEGVCCNEVKLKEYTINIFEKRVFLEKDEFDREVWTFVKVV